MGKHKRAYNDHTAGLNGETMMESDAKSHDDNEQKREKVNDLDYIRKSSKKKKKNREKGNNELTNYHGQTNDRENDGENKSRYNKVPKNDTLESKESNSLTLETIRISKKHKKKKKKSMDKCVEEIKDRSNESLHLDNALSSSARSKKRNRTEMCDGDGDEMTQSEDLSGGRVIGQDNHNLEKNDLEVQRSKHKRKKKRSNDNETSVITDNGVLPDGVKLGRKSRDCNQEKSSSEKQNDFNDAKISSPKSSHETNTVMNRHSKKKKKRKHKDREIKEQAGEVSPGKKMKQKGESVNGLDCNEQGIGISSDLNTNLKDTDIEVRLKKRKRKKKRNKDTDTEARNKGITSQITHEKSMNIKNNNSISETNLDLKTETSTNVIKGQWDTNALGDESKQNKFLRLLGGFKKGADTKSIHKKMFNVGNNNTSKETFSQRSSFGGSLAMNKSEQEAYKKTMEAEYHSAVTSHLNRGLGLGFQKPEPKKTFTIDTHNSKSIKFEESE